MTASAVIIPIGLSQSQLFSRRHPLYFGWLTVFWATPLMTAAHFVFALGMTAYIFTAIRYEERDLVQFHAGYADYHRRVPMMVPRLRRVDDRTAATVHMRGRRTHRRNWLRAGHSCLESWVAQTLL